LRSDKDLSGDDNHSDADISVLCDFLQENFGISITPKKYYLIKTKLNSVLISHNLASFSQLAEHLSAKKNSRLRQEVADRMATNETSWFRDQYPYRYLKEVLLPTIAENKSGHQEIRIWSMACSSGQEPYSISMVVNEWLDEAKYHDQRPTKPVRILATDLSSKMIDFAREGVYDKFSMSRGLDQKRKLEFFTQEPGDRWRIDAALRSRIEFRQLNLLDDFSLLGKFDIIYCRNVLIYFTPQLKKSIISRINLSLKKSAYLYLGSSEGVNEHESVFDLIQTVVAH